MRLLIFSVWLLSAVAVYAQGEQQVFGLSGIIVDGRNSEPLPGVHIYIPKAGRGAVSSGVGAFVIGVVPGDSLIISSLGFKKHFYIVPKDKAESYSVVIELVEDVTNLAIIEVFPYPTEEIFKEAFLNLELPDEEKMENLRRNLDHQLMTRLALTSPMDARMNYRNTMMQNVYQIENQTFLPTVQFTNPFAIARFIQSIRRGDFKKGKWKDKR